MDVAEATAAAFGQQNFLAIDVEVGKQFIAVDIGDRRADRNV